MNGWWMPQDFVKWLKSRTQQPFVLGRVIKQYFWLQIEYFAQNHHTVRFEKLSDDTP